MVCDRRTEGRRKDEDVCASHGALETDVKWIHKILYGMLITLTSAIVYYNGEQRDNLVELNASVTEVRSILLESKSQHDLEQATQGVRISSLETLCCSELGATN